MRDLGTILAAGPRDEQEIWLALRLVAMKVSGGVHFAFADQQADAVGDCMLYLRAAAAKWKPAKRGPGGAEAYFSRIARNYFWKWQRKNAGRRMQCESGKLDSAEKIVAPPPFGDYDRERKLVTDPESKRIIQLRFEDAIRRCRKWLAEAGFPEDIEKATIALDLLLHMRHWLLGTPLRRGATRVTTGALVCLCLAAWVIGGCRHERSGATARTLPMSPQTGPITPEPNSLLLFAGGLGAAIMIWPRRWRKLR